DPEMLLDATLAFGSQCIVIAIDARARNSSWEVVVEGGRTPTGLDAVEWATRCTKDLGAGEVLLTSMDRDGTKDGYDLALTKAVSDAVPVPIIASGGAGVPFYVKRATAVTGPVVELGAGTGRIAIPIAGAGQDVIGVDISGAMLTEAARRAATEDVADKISFMEADMRTFVADPPVELVI